MISKKSFSEPPLIMGILNVTLESFSDGGKYHSKEAALDRALKMIEEGADIIDIGGESTRPGSVSIEVQEELDRVIPVIEEIRKRSEIIISIDTTKYEVASAAIDAGATIINDVSMLQREKKLASLAASKNVELVLMHSRGTPLNMQDLTRYDNVVQDVKQELLDAAMLALSVGVEKDRIWIDPGIGFAKTAKQCIELISNLHILVETGFKVLLGPSRKSFISTYFNSLPIERLPGTLAAVTVAVLQGVSVLRVHDIAHTKQAVLLAHEFRKTMRKEL